MCEQSLIICVRMNNNLLFIVQMGAIFHIYIKQVQGKQEMNRVEK